MTTSHSDSDSNSTRATDPDATPYRHPDTDPTGPIHDDRTARFAAAQQPVGPTPHSPAPGSPAQESPASTQPTYHQAPAPAPQPRRRFGDIAVASVLSAILAAGGTYAVIELTDDSTTASTQSESEESAGGESSGDAEGTPVSLTGEQDWASVAKAVSPSTVAISVAGANGEGAGSGVVWDTEGHVVTNAHVVEGAQQVQVTLPDGRSYPAEVVGTDPSSDLAVVQLASVPDDLTPIAVGDDSALGVGDPVMAVGNPLGLSGTVTTGIVSALDRPVTTAGTSTDPAGQGVPVVTNAIQTSAAINPGNSGGALVNAAGELVGINSSIASLSSGVTGQSGSIGIGFAIPSGKVQLIADQLIATGTATHAFLGVGLDDGQAEVDGATINGTVVTQVEPGSPAEGAGMQAGDVIVSIDGEPVSSATALVGQVRERGAGEEATIGYVRDGAQAEVTVTLTTRPDEQG